MNDLFEQLKAAPPVNKYVKEAPPPLTEKSRLEKLKNLEKLSKIFDEEQNERASSSPSSPRRESMPPPASSVVFKTPPTKSRSVSPPKIELPSKAAKEGVAATSASAVKPFKVLIERQKLELMLAQSSAECAERKASMDKKDTEKNLPKPKDKLLASPPKKETAKKLEPTAKKAMPTKAQQKLFDPAVLKKAAQQQVKSPSPSLPKSNPEEQSKSQQKFKLRRCMVRVQRSNLKELQKKMADIQREKNAKKISKPKKSELQPKAGDKRKSAAATDDDDLSPSKRSKTGASGGKEKSAGFFIKLQTSPTTSKKTSPPKNFIKEKEKMKKKKDHSQHDRLHQQQNQHHSHKSSTKPTKFTRTQLIKTFGKRFFCSRVKIERCTHPLMLTFESNANARRLQSKRNKSNKNLSVSFKDQVEVFGSESDDSDDDASWDESSVMNGTAASSTPSKRGSANGTAASASQSVVMPARLKKVENGKVVDDIELDPSLFIDPQSNATSTPFVVPGGRKKREKKSYSPLKGDGTPSPRKEQLKLANENFPTKSLRRMNMDEDDEDDEDDDCEYIVPIEIPQRRSSRTSSNNAGSDDSDEPAADEPAADEPAADEPAAVEPAADEPAADEPAGDEAAADESAADEPAADEPAADEPAADEPAADEPAEDEPVADESAADERAADEPAADVDEIITIPESTPSPPTTTEAVDAAHDVEPATPKATPNSSTSSDISFASAEENPKLAESSLAEDKTNETDNQDTSTATTDAVTGEEEEELREHDHEQEQETDQEIPEEAAEEHADSATEPAEDSENQLQILTGNQATETSSFNSLSDLVDAVCKTDEEMSESGAKNVAGDKLNAAFSENIDLNLYVNDDSAAHSQNSDGTAAEKTSIVDCIVKETIDGLTNNVEKVNIDAASTAKNAQTDAD